MFFSLIATVRKVRLFSNKEIFIQNCTVFQEFEKKFQSKHEAVSLEISSMYASRHFKASDVRHFHHYLNNFHGFKTLRKIVLH